jgi:hypothetical protein
MTTDASALVMAQLSQRIDALGRQGDHVHAATLAADLDAIRRLAAANGFCGIAPVVHSLEAALGRGARGPVVANGIALLRDAARCGNDPRSGAALAAACALRVAG